MSLHIYLPQNIDYNTTPGENIWSYVKKKALTVRSLHSFFLAALVTSHNTGARKSQIG